MAESSAVQQPITELDETAVIARDLIRFDTTNYGEGRAKGEREAAEYVEAKLAALGLSPELFEPEPRRTSVVARVPGRDPDKPALVLHGHLDVVPADARNWSVDPFAGEVRDGMLWGRGAVDMKDMDAMMLTALGDILGVGVAARARARRRVLRRRGGRRRSSARSWLVDRASRALRRRDRGDQRGRRLLDHGRRRARVPAADGGEVADLGAARRARRRRARLAPHPRQRRSRSSPRPSRALGRTEWPLHLTDTTRELLAAIADDARRRSRAGRPRRAGPGDRLGVGVHHARRCAPRRTRPSSTAGYKHNVIPDRAEALVDIRTLPGQEDAVLAEMREIIGDDIEIEIVHQRRRPRGARSRPARRRR